VIMSEDEYMAHYGTLRESGRYPWGSGSDPYQRNASFLSEVAALRKEGMSNTEIAAAFGITTTYFREINTIVKNEQKAADVSQAYRLKERGWSNVEVGKRMGINESVVRSLLAPSAKNKSNILLNTAEMLRAQVAEKEYIDVGSGVELNPKVGVSRTQFKTALTLVKEEGYKIHYVQVLQLGTGKQTTMTVLSKPGVSYSEVYQNQDKIKQIDSYSEDGGRSYLGLRPPTSIDSKRVQVVYSEDGGTESDGVIYVRPGVEDLSLGESSYAQVRIAVDDSHFLKGMAVYKDDLPKGVDLQFNTTKSKKDVASDLDAMKPLTADKDNPFGSVIKPGGQRGVMNVLSEEGDWATWSKNLSSQLLSKQSPVLAKTQLDMTFQRKRTDLDQILKLTNPAVRKKLLDAFADDVDSSAVHLKAAKLPRQASHVILPVNSLKENEIYAPNYRNGEKVTLIRFPHGGIFEIPELVVNNKHREGKKLLGNAPDAVGINSRVAERLSGADFDGDTVLVIPNSQDRIKTAPALEGLKGFDPRESYPPYTGMREMSPRSKQLEMGNISNLITDMTIRAANPNEIARAVRHSMVVIDAEKHKLNYRQSAKDNGIKQLKDKYQNTGGVGRGASTLVSRSTSELRVDQRRPRRAADGGPVDKATGKLMYEVTGESYVNKKGDTVVKKLSSTRLFETDDANTLSSGTPIEKVYATHSNKLKGMGNEARLASIRTKTTPYSPSAKAAYSDEVAALDSKLTIALMNAPRERQAQLVAGSIVKLKQQASPNLEPDQVKKLKFQALAEARTRTGAKKELVTITPNEWDAVQAGAISNYKLTQILNNTDLDTIKALATPKEPYKMTAVSVRRAQTMADYGYTQADIADALGVSANNISTILSEAGV
jgi:predicted transcriptional regulator